MNFDPNVIAQYGAIGIMLAWFMFRIEKKLQIHTDTVNDLSRSILLDILSRENISERVRDEANKVLERTNARVVNTPR